MSGYPPYELYQEQLGCVGFGTPLWYPSPDDDRLKIGDVGFMRNGSFCRLFRATASTAQELGDRAPAGFESLRLSESDIQPRTKMSYPIYSHTMESYGVSVGDSNVSVPVSDVTGTSINFRFSKGKCALFLTRHDIRCLDSIQDGTFEQYVRKHCRSWIDLARSPAVGYGDIDPILISGLDSSQDYAMLTYAASDNQLSASVAVNIPSVTSLWANGWATCTSRGPPHYNCGPRLNDLRLEHDSPSEPAGQPQNRYVTFVRGWHVKYRAFFFPFVIKAAAEPEDLDREDPDPEYGVEVVSNVRHVNPLDVVFKFLFQNSTADCALIHDAVLQQISDVAFHYKESIENVLERCPASVVLMDNDDVVCFALEGLGSWSESAVFEATSQVLSAAESLAEELESTKIGFRDSSSMILPEDLTLDSLEKHDSQLHPRTPGKSPATALPNTVDELYFKNWSSTSSSSTEPPRKIQLPSVEAASNAHHSEKTTSDEAILYFPPFTTPVLSVRTALSKLTRRIRLNKKTIPVVPVKNDPKHILDTMLMSEEGFTTVARLTGEDAVAVADFIDKTLESDTQLIPLQRLKYFAVLGKLCDHSAILPTSHTLPDGLKISGEVPKAMGGFADVWEGTYKGRKVAIKALRVSTADDIFKVKKRFCKEALIWKRFSHPNVLPFLGVAASPFPFCMVSPWMPNGNVNQYLKANPQADRFQIIWDTAQGLSYLHSMDVVHGDLKGIDIMITGDHRACLADFGLATIATETMPEYCFVTIVDSVGTVRWMAPELLLPEEYGLQGARTKKSDIYAFGMVICEIITGNIPFVQVKNTIVVLSKVKNGTRPERPTDPATSGLVNAVWPLAEECWRQQRNERPTITQVLERLSQVHKHWDWILPSPTSAQPKYASNEYDDSDD